MSKEVNCILCGRLTKRQDKTCIFCKRKQWNKSIKKTPIKKKNYQIKGTSNKNTYSDSLGNRYTQTQIDRLIHEAKQRKMDAFIEEHGYVFCEDCKENTCVPIDMSHNISVDEAKKTGRVEMCWDVSNLTLRGRRCHQIHDKLK